MHDSVLLGLRELSPVILNTQREHLSVTRDSEDEEEVGRAPL